VKPDSPARQAPNAVQPQLARSNIMNALKKFWQQEDGVTALEYGMIAALIAGVLVAAVTLLGTNIKAVFNGIAGVITFTAPAA
jgi:pilus assembly protein Flp/PilA